ncbi:MAG: DNA ligase [Candidatus Anoxychlamydiales bacterium]|nr:DNA ligase [Candidatus Anoxychlamydiales bacterium]
MTERQRNPEKRIQFLESEIYRHRDLYYNEQPEVSDAKYDSLEDELNKLDSENPILFRVGVDRSELFNKEKHIIPMNSQDKVTQPGEFSKWSKKRHYKVFLVQFKLDGISIELQYEDGIFQKAITRGDGIVGDNVSANVVKMKEFIPKLKDSFTGAVRAEIVLYHDIYNKKHSDKQNCRNAAAGIVRRKDGIGSRDLNIIYYDAVSITDDVVFTTEIQKIKWLKDQNFPSVLTKTVKTPQEVIQIRENVMSNVRATLDYDIDGLVIKGKEIDTDDMKRAKPIKQIAFKFLAEGIETILKDVEWSISGHHYTPVAIVETVHLIGSNVSRASLANPNLIKDLNIKIGAEVFITKRGDIIPKIEHVIRTPSDAKEIPIPSICEVCNTPLINEGTQLYCPNELCPKRAYYRLTKWIKKLNIKHFSKKLLIKPLFDSGKINTIADLYHLRVSDLTRLDSVKETSAKKALDNLNAVKSIPLAKFIGGFAIENIGEDMVQKVVDAGFDTFEKIKSASDFQIAQVEGFADISAHHLTEGVSKLYPQMKEVLDTNKIKIQVKKIMGSKLKGQIFCFTGKLETMKRAEAEQMVKDNGGETRSGVSKNLTYLVTNSIEPTAKYNKAQEQDTEIITEAEFLEMIE